LFFARFFFTLSSFSPDYADISPMPLNFLLCASRGERHFPWRMMLSRYFPSPLCFAMPLTCRADAPLSRFRYFA